MVLPPIVCRRANDRLRVPWRLRAQDPNHPRWSFALPPSRLNTPAFAVSLFKIIYLRIDFEIHPTIHDDSRLLLEARQAHPITMVELRIESEMAYEDVPSNTRITLSVMPHDLGYRSIRTHALTFFLRTRFGGGGSSTVHSRLQFRHVQSAV